MHSWCRKYNLAKWPLPAMALLRRGFETFASRFFERRSKCQNLCGRYGSAKE
jgi:hypothetical protein